MVQLGTNNTGLHHVLASDIHVQGVVDRLNTRHSFHTMPLYCSRCRLKRRDYTQRIHTKERSTKQVRPLYIYKPAIVLANQPHISNVPIQIQTFAPLSMFLVMFPLYFISRQQTPNIVKYYPRPSCTMQLPHGRPTGVCVGASLPYQGVVPAS